MAEIVLVWWLCGISALPSNWGRLSRLVRGRAQPKRAEFVLVGATLAVGAILAFMLGPLLWLMNE